MPDAAPELNAWFKFTEKDRGSPSTVEVAINSPSKLSMVVRQRTFFDRLGLWLGLARNLPIKDPLLASKFYVETYQEPLATALLNDPSAPSIIQRLTNQSFGRIAWRRSDSSKGYLLSATCSGYTPNAASDVGVLKDVMAQLTHLHSLTAVLASSEFEEQKPRFVRIGDFLAWGCVALSLLVVVIAWQAMPDNHQELSTSGSLSAMFVPWACFGAALVITLWNAYWRTSSGHWRLTMGLLFGLPLSLLAFRNAHAYLNFALDQGPTHVVRFVIHEANVSWHLDRGNHRREDRWERRGTLITRSTSPTIDVVQPRFELSDVDFVISKPQFNAVDIEYSEGAFEIKWLKSLHFTTDPRAPTVTCNKQPHPLIQAVRAAEAQSQSTFVELIDRFYRQFREATTDLQRNNARRERCSAIDQLSPNVVNWIGTVEDISTGMFASGKAELTVRIAKNITVTTGSIGEMLISRDSPIFASLAKMKNGTRIRFSGKFQRDSTDGFEELSLTEKGSMKAPSFVIKFDTIKQVD